METAKFEFFSDFPFLEINRAFTLRDLGSGSPRERANLKLDLHCV